MSNRSQNNNLETRSLDKPDPRKSGNKASSNTTNTQSKKK